MQAFNLLISEFASRTVAPSAFQVYWSSAGRNCKPTGAGRRVHEVERAYDEFPTGNGYRKGLCVRKLLPICAPQFGHPVASATAVAVETRHLGIYCNARNARCGETNECHEVRRNRLARRTVIRLSMPGGGQPGRDGTGGAIEPERGSRIAFGGPEGHTATQADLTLEEWTRL